MLPHQNQRIGQHIQCHRQPATRLTHHELVLFELLLSVIKDGHSSTTPWRPYRPRPESPPPEPSNAEQASAPPSSHPVAAPASYAEPSGPARDSPPLRAQSASSHR